MSRQEKIWQLLDHARPILEELREEAMREISEAQERADRGIARHDEAAGELASIEARLTMLRAELDSLPVEHSRAVLNDDVDEELRLKARAAEVREEVSELEERADSLRGELRRLNPREGGHPNDATLHHMGRVAGVAYAARSDLERLRRELEDELARAVNPITRQHDSLRAAVQQLGRDREWDLSPVGRGGIRT